MKKVFFSFLFLSVSIFSTAQTTDSWKIDNVHSSINFSIRHIFSSVTGNFKEFSGDITFNPSKLSSSKVALTIPVSSINTQNERRDGHLQSEDFFEVAKYTTIKFQSTGISTKSDGSYMLNGNLTVKDITKKVTIPFKVLGQMENPRKAGSHIMGIEGEITINRLDFGVGVGNYAATTTLGDDVKVNFNLELNSI